MNNIGKFLRFIRKYLRMTQVDLAESLDVSAKTIGRWESGERQPRISDVEKIADFCGTTASDLMSLIDKLDRDDAGLLVEAFLHFSHKVDALTSVLNPKHPIIEDIIGEYNNQKEASSLQKDQLANQAANLRIPNDKSEMARIRVLSSAFVACCGRGFDWGNEAVEFEYEMLIHDPELVHFSPLVGLHVEGDSMEPDICDGDLVIFTENSYDIESTPTGDIMVVSYNGRMIVRGVIPKGKDTVILIARNKEYDDITVTPDDDFVICGRVVRVHRSWKPKPVI